ncbi:unnamed protein product [Mytilus edulis]|uniref:Neurotransmitter-gated ion-channel ligand-binding domain-containing protein n=1 Tax=Mytilus edulis TaxID=6550 RepID=A0A8S3RXE1_MYTED|nr:unnamed protein product [Mytilus edulis]
MTEDGLKLELIRCFGMLSPGPHVLKTQRYTEEEIKTTNQVMDLLKENPYRHMVICFPGKDDLNFDGVTENEFLQECTGHLGRLISRCQGNVLFVNNRLTQQDEIHDQWKHINVCIEKIITRIMVLITDYNKLAYPETTDNETVVVKHDMTLIRIVEFTPDIVLYDNPDTRLRFEPNAVIDQSGHVYYCQPIRLEVDNCRQFQDVFTCTLKFGSWTYDGFKIDLQNRSQVIDLSNFQLHTNYDIIDTSVVRNELHYACCPEPYPDITYTVNLKKIKTGWFDRLKLSFILFIVSTEDISVICHNKISKYIYCAFISNMKRT